MKTDLSFKRRSLGATIPEVLIIVFILVTVFYFGAVGISKTFKTITVRQAAQQLVDDIKFYQQKSITEQKESVFTFTAGQSQYIITYNGISKTKTFPKNVTVNSFQGLIGVLANELHIGTDGGVQNDSVISLTNSETTFNITVKTSGFIQTSIQ